MWGNNKLKVGEKTLCLKFKKIGNNVYVTDHNGGGIVRFAADGTLLRCHSIPKEVGIQLDSNGRIIISE